MRLSTRLAAAIFAVAPVAGSADGQESKDENLRIVHGAAASEADDGDDGLARAGNGVRRRAADQTGLGLPLADPAVQFAVLQGLGEPDVLFEPKPDRNMVGFFSRETFRFRVKRAGETGVAFGFFRPWEKTPPEKQVRILVRIG